MALDVAGPSRTLRHLRTNALPAGNSTVKLIGTPGSGNTFGLPCSGWGTIRVVSYCEGTAVTLNLLQKPQNGRMVAGGPGQLPPSPSPTPVFQMRQTDTRTISASGTSQTNDFNVRGDYYELDAVTTTQPTKFECEVTLLP